MSGTWDQPDFEDPRFSIEHVREVQVCRRPGCRKRAVYLVDYSMQRDGWTYDYGCGYCAEHVPKQALPLLP